MLAHWALLLFAAVIQVRCQQEYTVPLLGHGIQGEMYTLQVTYQWVDQATSGAKVTMDNGDTKGIPVAGFETYPVLISENDLPIQSQLKNKTRTVSVEANVPMQVITTIHGHSEGYQTIPNDQLATEYYVSTFCALGGYCQVVIGSTVEGTTQVYVKLPAEVDEIGFCIKNGTWYSKTNTTITLNYPEVVQLETTHDLTGTRIYSDNPVAVIVGSRTITGSTTMYHLAEQLVPVPEWGTEFVVRLFGTNLYGNILHNTSRYRKTYVTMDGFRTVELTGYGQTIKRRIVLGSDVRIKATKPVQVMLYTGITYASNEKITNPGMTLVPAKEHWRGGEVRIVCHVSNPKDVVHVIRSHDTTLLVDNSFSTPAITQVEYTGYVFDEYFQDLAKSPALWIEHTPSFAGLMTCDNTAIFPFRPLSLQQTAGGCSETLVDAYPNDGIDNDCDNEIDEDYCYENRVFVSGKYSMVNQTFVGQTSHRENVVDFTLIKFRLRSCGDVKLELVADTDKLVISISKTVFIIYKCLAGSSCTTEVFQPTNTYTANADCDTLVPYWIQRNSTLRLCMGVGPFPDRTCASSMTIDISGFLFTDMIMFGLHSNAVFYYDVYRADCGGLETDWRCTDMANNCLEYESDLCTTFADWAKINCRKFCNFCSPDSVGKMFVVLTPPAPYGEMEFHVIAANMPESTYNSASRGNQSVAFERSNATRKDGNMVTKMTSVGNTSDRVHVVYTSEESHLTVTARSNLGTMSIPVFPIDTLGTEYMTLSFSPDTHCIVSTAEGPTQVRKYSKTSDPKQFSIYLYDDIVLSSSESTGTLLSADRPVAVFCYSLNSNYPYWSQLKPTSSWGTHYILPALNVATPTGSVTATVRILANSANTRVEISGDFQSIELLAERGDFLDKTIDSRVTFSINSNFPIGVAVLYEDAESHEKSMITLPPVDNYMESTAILYNDLSRSVYFREVGVYGNDMTFTPNLTDTYIFSSLFYETKASPSLALSIVGDRNAVHMPGHLVKDLQTAQICTVTKGTAGDGVDNDCDGLVDEEASCYTGYGHYNNDTDLDADFGEDCLVSTDTNAIAPPAIPVCLRVAINPMNENDTHCWAACTCPCEWIDELNAYINMTPAERNASNLEKIQAFKLILKIDKTILSMKVAEKQSAEDSRTSSANIGIVGIVLLTLVFCLIGFMDFVNVIRYFRNMWKASSK